MTSVFKYIKTLFQSFFRIYVGVNTFFLAAIIILVAYFAFLKDLFLLFINLIWSYNGDLLSHNIAAGTIGSLLGAVLFGLVIALFFGLAQYTRLTGSYSAEIYNQNSQSYAPWGEVVILYYPLGNPSIHTPVKLRLKFDHPEEGTVTLVGDGLIINNQILIGHYCESSDDNKSRYGTFFYQLSGDGRTWSGDYRFLDPTTSAPQSNSARWIKKG